MRYDFSQYGLQRPPHNSHLRDSRLCGELLLAMPRLSNSPVKFYHIKYQKWCVQFGGHQALTGQEYSIFFVKNQMSRTRPISRWPLPDGYSQIFGSYVFCPFGFWTMAPLCYAAKFDPFLSLDYTLTPSTLAQSK